MILITGATGQFGKNALHFLLKGGMDAKNLRVLIRKPDQAHEFLNLGVDVSIGDYNHYQSLLDACKGVEQLLFVSSSDLLYRSVQHQLLIQAAKASAVKNVVYTSFQGRNQTSTSPLWMVAESHIKTENWLKESGMSYTILKNNLYMDFLPAFIGEQVAETGVIYVPAGDGLISPVLRQEMAEAAANIFLSDGHQGKVYQFTNMEAVSYHQIAAIISEAVGKNIQYVSPSAYEYEAALKGFGLPTEAIGVFTSFAVGQAMGELDATSDDMFHLLGRKPLTVKDFLAGLYNKVH